MDTIWPLTWITPVTGYLALTSLAAVAYYYYTRDSGDDWSRVGVKCPTLSPFYFFGDDFRKPISALLDQYGDVVGVKNRSRLSLFTTNFDLLRHVFIKDFNNFVDRDDGLNSQSPFAKSLFFAKGDSWRRHRQIVSPTFTSGKLKSIAKTVEKSAETLANYLEDFAKSGETVPIKETTGRFTCEVIAKTGFGLNVSFIGQRDVEFFEYAKSMLWSIRGYSLLFRQLLFMIHPNTTKYLNKLFKNLQFFEPINLTANAYFKSTLDATVTERRRLMREGKERTHVDFLDLLLKANEAVKAGRPEADEDESEAVGWRSTKALAELTDEEILGHSMLVIFAGLETTATALQMCLYSLARNPDIQEKVYEEVCKVVKNASPSPDELNSLSYTEAVINETLRLYPPVPIVTRKAKETKTYNGVTVLKGAVVQVPFFHILKDPKLWPEPEKFKPERFFPEAKEGRDPLAFVCFGHGPRICLGMRLAYLELKEALVYILRKVRVVLNEGTEPRKDAGPVQFTSQGLLTPVNPIRLAFELRGGAKPT
ncbi:unnamed protein product [Lymnaea stagnalis]|uniref:Cytochrome P450 n=1 Tax=Lymnaea stagnalis TaxID=6523 RepID=A0AAV2H3J4_LYMST